MKLNNMRRWRSTNEASSGDDSVSPIGDSSGNDERPSLIGYRRIAAALAITLILLVIFQYGIRGALGKAGFIATPQDFTELYFAQPNALPKVLKLNRLNLDFVIANHEGSRHLYAWTADFSQGGVSNRLASGSVEVKNNGTREIALVLLPRSVSGAGILYVTLSSPHQSINFHLNIVTSGANH